MSDTFARVQEKGQVAIPVPILRKLNVGKGDLVVFVETEAGVVIKPAEMIVLDAFAEIGRSLETKGVGLHTLIEQGRKLRGDLIAKEYSLGEPAHT